MPPQADWMLMSSIRDSSNWFFDFEGSPDESTSMKTSSSELSEWYAKTGFYSSVTYSGDTSLAKIKAISKKQPRITLRYGFVFHYYSQEILHILLQLKGQLR